MTDDRHTTTESPHVAINVVHVNEWQRLVNAVSCSTQNGNGRRLDDIAQHKKNF